MQLIVQKRGYRLFPLAGLVLAIGFLVFIAGNSMAISDVGNFEIDNTNEEALGPAPDPPNDVPPKASYFSGVHHPDDGVDGDDWAQGPSQDGIFQLSASDPDTAATNCYGSDIDVNPAIAEIARFMCDGFAKISGFPEQNLISPSGDIPHDFWPVKAGSLGVPKDDLSHGYYLQRVQDCSGTPHNIVIVGMERGNNEGANHWGLELNAVPPDGLGVVANNQTPPSADFGLDFNRVDGDVFVSIELERGGTVPTITVTTIDGTPAQGADATFVLATPTNACGSFAPNRTATNLVEQTAPPWNVIVCDPTTTDNGSNTCRLANETGGEMKCGTKQNPVACNTIAQRTFVEVAIDLTAYGVTQGCFSDVLLTSRSAPPGGVDPVTGEVDLSGADVKDITASFLPPCDITILKKDADTGDFIGPFTATMTPNPFACQTPNPFPGDPLTLTDNVAPDDDSDAGVIHLSDVCPGNYSTTETVAPPGYSLDPDGSNPATCAVVPGSSTSCTFTFEDPLGDLTINKQDDQGNPQGGATFTIEPNPFACQPDFSGDATILTVTDGGTGDPDATADGDISLTRVCIPDTVGHVYTVTETAAPNGFALPSDVDQTCEVSENTTPEQSCSVTFQNRLGTIEWEKRVLSDTHPLQGGAQFSISPNPFACWSGTDPGTFTDNSAPDADADDGQFRVERVCMGTYTITEETAPTGSLKDEDDTRSIAVDDPQVTGGGDELNPVVGSSLAGDTDDDSRTPHGSGACADEECDFHNRQASLIIRKEAKDARTVATDDLLCGATFLITPNPLTGAGTMSITDACPPDAGDTNDAFGSAGGLICIDSVVPGTYSVQETAAPANYKKADPDTQSGVSTSVGLCADRGTSATADVTFINTPLSEIEILFESLAGAGVTQASISCAGETADPENGNPDPAFDDSDETYTDLEPGTYNCTIVIDP